MPDTASQRPAGARRRRADQQRDRILSAAQTCFAERGFHAASMASIAETAGMSPGLIYRYFESKSQIIQGIVRRQNELLLEQFEAWRDQPVDMAENIFQGYYQCAGTDDDSRLSPALLLEIWAEASRDPNIAEATAELDRAVDAAIARWLTMPRAQGGAGLDAERIPGRVLMLRCVFEGLKTRQARQPELDPDLLRAALEDGFARLLE